MNARCTIGGVLILVGGLLATVSAQDSEEDRKRHIAAMTELDRAVQGSDYARGVKLAEALKADLNSQEKTDPNLLGWVRFYQFKSLFMSKRYADAYELHATREPKVYIYGWKNASWVSSVAAECAARLGRPKDVVRLMLECIEFRKQGKDAKGILMAAGSGIQLLETCDGSRLGAPFLKCIVDLGLEYGAGRVVIDGLSKCRAHQSRSVDPELTRYLAEQFAALVRVRDARMEVIAELAKVREAEWFRKGIGADGVRRLEQGRALWEAAGKGDPAGVEKLLSAGADPNHFVLGGGVPTPLINASFSGHANVVRRLLKEKPDLELENVQHRTALVLAADQDRVECVKLLAEAGANLNHKGFGGQTGLVLASWQGYVKVVEALLARGADTEVLDATGRSALNLAATEDVPDVIEALLKGGANIESTTPQGHTPLMCAAMEGKTRVVKVLLKRGADTEAKDANGFTALDWARQEKKAGAVKLLEKR